MTARASLVDGLSWVCMVVVTGYALFADDPIALGVALVVAVVNTLTALANALLDRWERADQ